MKYFNPIIRGFNPDPSICRVDNDYYIVTSTFEYFPAIPVYRSTDLVNWEQIGNCIESKEQLNFENVMVEGGMWAPTIRFYEGKFYVVAKFKEFGNFIISSENPATGWSKPVKVDIEGIDPSIFFEDGKAYYCTNARGKDDKEAISLVEINPETGEMLSEIKQIWHGASENKPQYLEAPHIYHIGRWYYIWCAEGGTGYNHMITVARSSNIWGPYENCPNNPILTNKNKEEKEANVAGSGHGDLVEDSNGNWWVVHLATRPNEKWYSPLGRETFLLPVIWKDEWPVIGDGMSHIGCEAPLWNEQKLPSGWKADFSKIGPQWLFLRNPVEENYILKQNYLILKPSNIKISDEKGSPTFMALRQFDIRCILKVQMSFETERDGDEAGLTIYTSNKCYFSLYKKNENGKNYIFADKNTKTFEQVKVEIEEGIMNFKIELYKDRYKFYCSINGKEYNLGEFKTSEKEEAGKSFTGVLMGMYAQCNEKTNAQAEIYSFEVEKF